MALFLLMRAVTCDIANGEHGGRRVVVSRTRRPQASLYLAATRHWLPPVVLSKKPSAAIRAALSGLLKMFAGTAPCHRISVVFLF
jgi:hypothetical protein